MCTLRVSFVVLIPSGHREKPWKAWRSLCTVSVDDTDQELLTGVWELLKVRIQRYPFKLNPRILILLRPPYPLTGSGCILCKVREGGWRGHVWTSQCLGLMGSTSTLVQHTHSVWAQPMKGNIKHISNVLPEVSPKIYDRKETVWLILFSLTGMSAWGMPSDHKTKWFYVWSNCTYF